MADAKEKANTEEKKDSTVKSGKKAQAAKKEETKPSWTLEMAKRFARRYNTEAEWSAGHQSSYKSATAHGWVAECVAQMGEFKNKASRKKAA